MAFLKSLTGPENRSIWGVADKCDNAAISKLEAVRDSSEFKRLTLIYSHPENCQCLLLSNGHSMSRSGWQCVFVPVKSHRNSSDFVSRTKKLKTWFLGIGQSFEATWLPHVCSQNVLNFLWIFAVDACQTALISHLPSAGLCEESSSLFCPLCLLWRCSATLAIRQSCRDSSY